jgi:hypothetical protein
MCERLVVILRPRAHTFVRIFKVNTQELNYEYLSSPSAPFRKQRR